jgi:predicted dithiol-disulfide oxidoreductase (DUF899 family)
MTDHPVANEEEWLAARRELLAEEKDFTRLRDQLSAKRRAMPWLKIDKDYRFDGPEGQNLTLSDLFGARRQLILYHFIFGPDWEKPCKSCSFGADGYDGVTRHLAERDTRLVAVSRAPRPKLEATARQLGWAFPGIRPAMATSITTSKSRSIPIRSKAARSATISLRPRPR